MSRKSYKNLLGRDEPWFRLGGHEDTNNLDKFCRGIVDFDDLVDTDFHSYWTLQNYLTSDRKNVSAYGK